MKTVMFAMVESLTGRHVGVRSVFSVKQCPGRLYIEANCINSARELLKRTPLVYWNNVYVVQDNERTQLLHPINPPALSSWDWVKIRSGLYRGDVGQVTHVDNDEMYEVIVVPRISPRPTPMSGKRPRTNKSRVPARRMKTDDAIRMFGNKITLTEHGYEFQGHPYHKEGFRGLYLRFDAVKPYRPTMTEIAFFMDAAIEKIMAKHDYPKMVNGKLIQAPDYNDEDLQREGGIYYEKLRIESLLEVHDEIEVVYGEMTGMFGRVVAILKNNIIRVHVKTDEGEIEIDKDVDDIREVFRLGDSVTVKIGVLAGRTGLVEAVDDYHLVVREINTVKEVCINLQMKISD